MEGTAWAASPPKAGEERTGFWLLMVADSLIAEKKNLRRTYHPFTKHPGNPVLVADQPWEGRMAYLYGTVLPTPGGPGYQMWYHSWAGEYRNLLATSIDGIVWTKPALDLIDFNGSKANNRSAVAWRGRRGLRCTHRVGRGRKRNGLKGLPCNRSSVPFDPIQATVPIPSPTPNTPATRKAWTASSGPGQTWAFSKSWARVRTTSS